MKTFKLVILNLFEPPHNKTNKMTVGPVKTQISLGWSVWSEPWLWAWRKLGRCPGWSESSLGAHAILLVLSWGGSFVYNQILPEGQFIWASMFWEYASWERDWTRSQDEICWDLVDLIHATLPTFTVLRDTSQVSFVYLVFFFGKKVKIWDIWLRICLNINPYK